MGFNTKLGIFNRVETVQVERVHQYVLYIVVKSWEMSRVLTPQSYQVLEDSQRK